MFIRNLTEVEVQSTQEALQVLMRGRRYRQVAATDLNDASSRSHSVFNIKVLFWREFGRRGCPTLVLI